MTDLLKLAETLEGKANSARKMECSPAYQSYWRGYAEALDETAELLRARASMEKNDG